MPIFLTPCLILLHGYFHGVVLTIRRKGENPDEAEIWGPFKMAQELFVQVFRRFRPLENFVNLIKKASPSEKKDKE
jgi:hypothetical protein